MAQAKFIDDFELELSIGRAEAKFPDVAEKAIRAGAGIFADEMRAGMKRAFSRKSTGELADSMGITPVGIDSYARYNAHVGFDGYNKRGRPFQVIARSLENGWKYETVVDGEWKTIKHKGYHFAKKAREAAMPRAIAEMNRVADIELEKALQIN